MLWIWSYLGICGPSYLIHHWIAARWKQNLIRWNSEFVDFFLVRICYVFLRCAATAFVIEPYKILIPVLKAPLSLFFHNFWFLWWEFTESQSHHDYLYTGYPVRWSTSYSDGMSRLLLPILRTAPIWCKIQLYFSRKIAALPRLFKKPRTSTFWRLRISSKKCSWRSCSGCKRRFWVYPAGTSLVSRTRWRFMKMVK